MNSPTVAITSVSGNDIENINVDTEDSKELGNDAGESKCVTPICEPHMVITTRESYDPGRQDEIMYKLLSAVRNRADSEYSTKEPNSPRSFSSGDTESDDSVCRSLINVLKHQGFHAEFQKRYKSLLNTRKLSQDSQGTDESELSSGIQSYGDDQSVNRSPINTLNLFLREPSPSNEDIEKFKESGGPCSSSGILNECNDKTQFPEIKGVSFRVELDKSHQPNLQKYKRRDLDFCFYELVIKDQVEDKRLPFIFPILDLSFDINSIEELEEEAAQFVEDEFFKNTGFRDKFPFKYLEKIKGAVLSAKPGLLAGIAYRHLDKKELSNVNKHLIVLYAKDSIADQGDPREKLTQWETDTQLVNKYKSVMEERLSNKEKINSLRLQLDEVNETKKELEDLKKLFASIYLDNLECNPIQHLTVFIQKFEHRFEEKKDRLSELEDKERMLLNDLLETASPMAKLVINTFEETYNLLCIKEKSKNIIEVLRAYLEYRQGVKWELSNKAETEGSRSEFEENFVRVQTAGGTFATILGLAFNQEIDASDNAFAMLTSLHAGFSNDIYSLNSEKSTLEKWCDKDFQKVQNIVSEKGLRLSNAKQARLERDQSMDKRDLEIIKSNIDEDDIRLLALINQEIRKLDANPIIRRGVTVEELAEECNKFLMSELEKVHADLQVCGEEDKEALKSKQRCRLAWYESWVWAMIAPRYIGVGVSKEDVAVFIKALELLRIQTFNHTQQ